MRYCFAEELLRTVRTDVELAKYDTHTSLELAMPLLRRRARPEAFVAGKYAGELASVHIRWHVEGHILETFEIPDRSNIPALLLHQQPVSPGTAHILSCEI